MSEATPKYSIVRMYQDDELDSQIVRRNLTLEQAQAHCNDPETSSRTATNAAALERTRRYGPWFDGYQEQKRGRRA